MLQIQFYTNKVFLRTYVIDMIGSFANVLFKRLFMFYEMLT